jgi:hypothetical protein
MRAKFFVFLLLTLVGGGVCAADDAPPKPPPPKPCSAPEFRQFDFWIGDWNVVGQQGNAVGTNRITLEEGSCILHEHWTGAKGGTGQSFNLYDARDKQWHQIWVDNSGSLLQLAGGIVDGKMVLDGPGRGPAGEAITNRIVWEKLADGRVRQTWTVSKDSGKTWSTSFDGFYAKK